MYQGLDPHRCTCGNVKSVRARTCRQCYDMMRTVRADDNPKVPLWQEHDECPRCGGVKMKQSKLCIDCYLETRRKPMPTCSVCGLTKKDRRGSMCRKCADEARRKETEHVRGD